LKGGSATPSDP